MKKLLVAFTIVGLTACNGATNKNSTSQDSIDENEYETTISDDTIVKEEVVENEPATAIEYDPVVGSYKCYNTGDKMAFYSNNTGLFVSGEGGSHDFTWRRYDNTVTITYGGLGSDRLTFNKDNHTLTLKTSLYGTLVFE